MEEWPNQNNNKQETPNFSHEDLVIESVKYLSGRLTEKESLLLKKIKEEAVAGVPDLGEIKKEDNMYLIGSKVLTSYLEFKNFEGRIFDTKKGEPLTKDGDLLKENEYVKIQVNDEQKHLKENERLNQLIEIIKEESENFITPVLDSFKSIIVVDENLLSIRIDSGHHKEFLGVLLLEGEKNPSAIIHKHTSSSYEQANKNKTYRANYIQKITSGKIDEKREVFSMAFIDDPNEFKEKFREYFRLCQSVKNLDLKLREEDILFAVNMFKEGVANMEYFLTCCDTYNSFEEYLQSKGRGKLINHSEEKILERYFAENKKEKGFIKEKLKLLQSAKDLNFEIIDNLINLDNKARDILITSSPSHSKADDFKEAYKKIADKIVQMEKFTKSVVPFDILLQEVNTRELTERLYKNMEQLSFVARFGYGDHNVLKYDDGSVDVSEEGKKRLPEIAKKAYEQFAKIFQDKGNRINQWSDVESLEEAVRFLHDLIIKIPVLFTGYGAISPVKSKFFRKEKMEENLDSLNIINITSNKLEKSELAKTVIGNLKSFVFCGTDIFKEKEGRNYPTAIFADDHFELSLPTAKHYIEMSSQIYDKEQKEYTIALRYVESGYQGAIQRQDFAAAVFEQLGFTVKRDRREIGNLYANFKSDEKEIWKKALQDTLRLSVALKDMDLFRIESDVVELFKEGVIIRFEEFRKIKQTIKSKGKINDDIKKNVERIMRLGSNSEKYVLLNLLSANMKSFDKDFAPFLDKLNENQLDNIALLLFDIEDETKKKKDKKLADRLHRIGDKVVKLIYAKEDQNQQK